MSFLVFSKKIVRIFARLLSITGLVTVLIACGGNNSQDPTTQPIEPATFKPVGQPLTFEIDTRAPAAESTWQYDEYDTLINDYSDPNNKKIELELWTSHTYDFDIDWGDGTTQSNVSQSLTHTFPKPGRYTIKIYGKYSRPKFEGLRLQKLLSWGDIEYLSFAYSFMNATGEISTTEIPNHSKVSNYSSMFSGATAIPKNIAQWDMSQATNTSSMFRETDFNQDISDWNVSNVTNMEWMFAESDFNQDISNWNVSKVVNMRSMFLESAFNQPIANWDVSKVTNMSAMFKSSKFDQPIDAWDVSNVKDMSYMFAHSNFNQDLNSWDVSSVKNMSAMFHAAPFFNGLIANWDVSSVKNMSNMFSAHTLERFGYVIKDSVFNQDLSTWDVSGVTDMSYMFSGTGQFNQDISQWNVSSVINMNGMFSYAYSFNQDISQWNVTNVTSMNDMFTNLYWAGDDMPYSIKEDMMFNQDLGQWNISNVEDMEGMLQGLTLTVENYDALLQGWSTRTVIKDLTLDAGENQFSSASASARDLLLTEYGWTINDGGQIE